MPALAQQRLFTVDEYYTMADAGILTPADHVELIQGEVIAMSPIGSHHAACVNRLTRWLAIALGERAILSVQNPIRLDDFNEPEPDIAILKPCEDFYASAHAGPADTLLVVEVSASSLVFDRKVKLPLYALHGIPEIWVVNLVDDWVEVHSRPQAGAYQSSRKFRRGRRLVPLAFPDLSVEVENILGR